MRWQRRQALADTADTAAHDSKPFAFCLAQDDGKSAASKTFAAAGQVKHPGHFNLREGMRVIDAIQMVGFPDYADTKRITIIRGSDRHKFSYPDFPQESD